MIEEKETILDQKVTRRDFLKISGMSVLGISAVSWLFPGCSNAVNDEVMLFENASGVIVHISNRCTGCLLCESTCSVVNDGKASQTTARVKISRNFAYGPEGVTGAWWNNPGDMGNFKLVAETCRQCEVPACALACPEQAIYQDKKTGAKIVDAEKCIGCGTCTAACPWNIPTVDPDLKVSTKCVLCHGYPGCVSTCPTGALNFVTWEDAIQKYKEHFKVS